jgi:hypothetical protein
MNYERVTILIYFILEYLNQNDFVLNEYPRIKIFDSKSIEGIIIGYSITSKSYRIYIQSS